MASFSVVSNVSAVTAQSNLATTSVGLQRTLTRLSSGYRINQSGDDAAALVVANSYRSREAFLAQGIRNANDAVSSLQIKDGALSNISTLLDRLATLAAQSASNSGSLDRHVLNTEFQDVLGEIDREARAAGVARSGTFSVFLGDQGTNGTVAGAIGAADTGTLGVSGLDISDVTSAASAVGTIAAAVTTLGAAQCSIGLLQNRLQFAISPAQAEKVNSQSAESRIRDANVAEESANLAKFNILTQSGIAALAQANQTSSSVLTLLR